MKRASAFTFIILFINLSASAQEVNSDSLKAIYERETIFLDGNSGMYVKDGKKKRIGFFGRKIMREFENSSAETRLEIKKFGRNRRKAAVLLGASVVILVGATVLEPMVGFSGNVALISLAFLASTAGGSFTYKASRNLEKAIWLINRDVLIRNANF